jgi:hypothetical protein
VAGQEIGQRDAAEHADEQRDRGALDRHLQGRPEPGDAPAFVAALVKDAVGEGPDRKRQVEDQQGTEPEEQARRPAQPHEVNRAERELGTPVPVTFAGETISKLSAFISAWPAGPSRNLMKASAAASCGAFLISAIV